MTLRKSEFGSPDWNGASILIHGMYNTGKTKLGAAALAHFAPEGRVLFASFTEEQGFSSAAGMGLDYNDLGYQCLYEIETIDDFKEWLDLVEKEKPIAVVVDSLWALYRAIQKKITGGARPPKAGKSDSNEWPIIHNEAHNIMTRLRQCCKWVIVLCPSDTGQNVLKEVETGGMTRNIKVTPDLNGKMAEGCITWFNLVGYLMLDERKQGQVIKTVRTLSFDKSLTFVTRQRMPKPIEEKIDIPEGDPGAGWAKLMELGHKSYQDAYKQVKESV